jgi:uncharacterized protein YecE (DUF72 family)
MRIQNKLINTYIGTSGWTYDHWKGIFYPEGLAKRRWFEYYVDQFSAVEVNATFYRNFKDETYHNWREQVGTGFRYVLKVPRLITHRKYLLNVKDEIQQFWKSACLLEDRLGAVLLQLPPQMPYDLARLQQAILAFGEPEKVAVEFRNKKWYAPELRRMLEDTGAIFCSVDSPTDHGMDWVTSGRGYIRLHGRGQWYGDDYDDQMLGEVKLLAERMAAQGAKEVFIFFNNDYHGYAPRNAKRLEEMIRGKKV